MTFKKSFIILAVLILIIILFFIFKNKNAPMVLIPSYLPDGFSMYDFKTMNFENGMEEYEVTFCNEEQDCFSIDSICDGMGDPIFNDPAKYSSDRFGDFYLGLAEVDPNYPDPIPYISTWLVTGKKCENYGFQGYGISESEAVRIIQSLEPGYN